ncbi:MAG: DUF2029 domain-containing protein [Alphaproteobacteria bacterium]|nr:DUF2029 domain-containing protein [Alphaproteobacteria bacterium]
MISALGRLMPAIRPHMRHLAIAAAVLVVASALAGAFSAKGVTSDFANFYDAGHKALAGETDTLFDPHALIEGKPPLANMGFFSAPITAYLYAPLSTLEPRLAMRLFKIENALAILLALVLLYAHARRFAAPGDEDLYAALFLGMALVYMPLWTVFRVGGQTTPTVFLLLVAALTATTSRRMVLAAALLFAAAAIKPFLAPCLALLALTQGWRFFLALAGISAAVGLASVAIMGWPVHAEFLGQLAGIANEAKLPQLNSSLTAGLEAVLLALAGGDAGADKPLLVAIVATSIRLGIVGFVVWLYISAQRSLAVPAARRHFTFVLAVLFALLFTPVVWAHYLSFVFILIAYLAASWRSLPLGANALVGLIVLLAMGQHVRIVQWIDSHIGFESLAMQVAVAEFKSLPLLLTLILLWKFRDAIFATYRAPAWRTLSDEGLPS